MTNKGKESGSLVIAYIAVGVTLLLLFFANILAGPVKIPLGEALNILFGKLSTQQSWNQIVLSSRLPQAVTALLGGAALAVSGLLLQTFFKNPLAGPSILGISDGANLGVALAMLYISTSSYVTTIAAALIGAAAVLAIIIWFSHKVRNNVMLLIIGIIFADFDSKLQRFGRQGASVCNVGHGRFRQCVYGQAPLVRVVHGSGINWSIASGEAAQCSAARRIVCREPGH